MKDPSDSKNYIPAAVQTWTAPVSYALHPVLAPPKPLPRLIGPQRLCIKGVRTWMHGSCRFCRCRQRDFLPMLSSPVDLTQQGLKVRFCCFGFLWAGNPIECHYWTSSQCISVPHPLRLRRVASGPGHFFPQRTRPKGNDKVRGSVFPGAEV